MYWNHDAFYMNLILSHEDYTESYNMVFIHFCKDNGGRWIVLPDRFIESHMRVLISSLKRLERTCFWSVLC